MDSEVLHGGVSNVGAVVRVGRHVLRPASPHAQSIHRFLDYVRDKGFDGLPQLVGSEPDGRERWIFIEGDVPTFPYPTWAQTDQTLASTASLLGRFHSAAAGYMAPSGDTWDRGLADRVPGPIVCHNDVCPENVVYRKSLAIALLDFDLAAPGRPLYDLAQLANMFVPIETPEDAALTGRGSLDPFRRLRIVADAYGLPPGRGIFLDILGDALAIDDEFVRIHVEAGEEAFVTMCNRMGGPARWERRQEWFNSNRQRFVDILG